MQHCFKINSEGVKIKSLLVLFVLSFFSSWAYPQAQIQATDAVTGAQSWELKQYGVVLYLNQLLPDQIRAFYANRGFSQSQIKGYVQSCVFMAVLRNESAKGSIKYNTSDWRIITNAQSRAIKSSNEWIEQYTSQNIKNSALIAFRWAQFPAEQEYEPGGDWNQGMLSLGASEQEFDVVAHWLNQNKSYQMSLTGVRCAH